MELLLSLVIVLLVGPYVLAGWSLAPWVPTMGRDVERVVRLVGADPEAREFVEIGSGDGRVTFAVARAYPHMRCRGIERYFPVWLYSRIRLIFEHLPNASVEWGDFYRRDISRADTLFCFGHPSTLIGRFVAKLAECRPGTRLVSYAFAVEGLEPDTVDRPEGSLPIRVYVLPGASDLKPLRKSV